MNRREIFDTVRAHLLSQNAKALDYYGCCRYLSGNGFRCAIGCLIPDGHEALDEEGGVASLVYNHPDLAKLWGIDTNKSAHICADTEFLLQLQRIHDSSETKDWKTQLSVVEEVYVV